MEQIESRDGTIIGYRKSGTGPPLLLVHGTSADHQRWARITPGLEEDFTVYAMDRRGRGASGDSPLYEFAREAEDVAAVVGAIEEPVFAFGHSYGALCCLEGALLTDNLRKMILYEPPVPTGEEMYPSDVPDRMQALIDRGELEAALEIFFLEVVCMPSHEFEMYSALPMWQVRIALAPTIPRELTIEKSYVFEPHRFASLNVPTLLMHGGDSPAVFRRAGEKVNAVLPGSRILILPDQQHIAMDTDPEMFIREIRRFLQE